MADFLYEFIIIKKTILNINLIKINYKKEIYKNI
jgi:hypothetical protein